MKKEQLGADGELSIVNGQEKELNDKRLQNFVMAISKKGEVEKLTIDEMIEELVVDLPVKLQKEMIRAFERFQKKGLRGTDLKEEVVEIRRILKAVYEDPRFEMENKVYAKLQAIKMIDGIFNEENLTAESFRKIARISFDLNGLKAVNDLTGSHSQGDKYLKLIVNVLRGEKATAWLAQKGMEAVITIDGGDEFGVILKSENEIDEKEINDEFIVGVIKKELWESEVSRDILDFNDVDVVEAYAGLNRGDLTAKTVEEREVILEEIRKGIPDGYFFRATISGGVVTLYESFAHMEIEAKDSYEKVLERAMGSLFDLSDKEMQIDKINFKINLAKSQDPHENFLLKVYSRTDSEKELRNILDAYELFLRNVEEAVGEGTASVLPKVIEDLKKQISEIEQRAKKVKK
jgi:GGDEF domain-containing protein